MAIEVDYEKLKDLLIDELGQDVVEKLTDKQIRQFCDFLILCGEMCILDKQQ